MVIKNAQDSKEIFGEFHPYTLISEIMDYVSDNYGKEVRVFIRKLDGDTPMYTEINHLWDSGELCWCII